MSVRFDASGDRYTATNGAPGSTFTALWWGRIAVDRNAYSTMLAIDNGTTSQVLSVQTDTDGTSPYLWLAPHGTNFLDESPTVAMTVGSWYRFAIVRNGTAVTYYAASATGTIGSASGTLTGTLTATTLRLGESPAGGEWWNGNLANLKIYSAALTQTEIVTEWGNWQAQRTTSLLRHHKWQTAAETTDYGPNGYALTTVGTPTFEATNPAINDSAPGGGGGGVSGMAVGASALAALRVGDTLLSRAYVGSTLLWQAAAANPADMTDVIAASFTASNGQTGNYHRYAANLPYNQELGLMVQLHGDGYQEYTERDTTSYSIGGTEGLLRQARYRNMICVVARTPDESGGTWWENGTVNSVYLRDLLNNLLTTYPNVPRSKIWLVGYSGGSEQIARYFMPSQSAYLAGGGAFCFSGGGLPDTTELAYATSLRAAFPMKWYVGTSDNGTSEANSPGLYDALGDCREGSAHYSTKGFTTYLEEIPGGNHFVADGRYGAIWGQFYHQVKTAATVSGTVTRTSTGVSWTGTVANAPAVTLRASTSAFGTQTGTWAVGAVDLTTRTVTVAVTGFSATGTLYWRLELGGNTTQGPVLTSGSAP